MTRIFDNHNEVEIIDGNKQFTFYDFGPFFWFSEISSWLDQISIEKWLYNKKRDLVIWMFSNTDNTNTVKMKK